MYTYKYPRPALAVDIVVFASNHSSVLLIKRKNDPFKGCWALPGGFVDMNETTYDAALRELKEETGIQISDYLRRGLQLIDVASEVNRDPRERVVSISYGINVFEELPILAGDDASHAEWVSSMNEEELVMAFDHLHTLRYAHQEMLVRGK